MSIRSKSKLYLLFIDYPFRQLQTSSTTQTTRPLRPTDFFSTCPSGSRRSFSARPIGVSGTCSAKPNRPSETSTTTLERGRARTEKLRTNPETIARIKARMTRRAVWKPYEMAGKVMAEKVREKVMDIVMPTETMLTDTTKMMILTTTKSLKRKLLTKVKKQSITRTDNNRATKKMFLTDFSRTGQVCYLRKRFSTKENLVL